MQQDREDSHCTEHFNIMQLLHTYLAPVMSVRNYARCHHSFSMAIDVTIASRAKTNHLVENDYTRTNAHNNLNALGGGNLEVHPTLTSATFLGRGNLQLHPLPAYAAFL